MEDTIYETRELGKDVENLVASDHFSADVKQRLERVAASINEATANLAEAHERAMLDRSFLWVRRVTNASASMMSAANGLSAAANMVLEERNFDKAAVKEAESRARELHSCILATPRPVFTTPASSSSAPLDGALIDIVPSAPVLPASVPPITPTNTAQASETAAPSSSPLPAPAVVSPVLSEPVASAFSSAVNFKALSKAVSVAVEPIIAPAAVIPAVLPFAAITPVFPQEVQVETPVAPPIQIEEPIALVVELPLETVLTPDVLPAEALMASVSDSLESSDHIEALEPLVVEAEVLAFAEPSREPIAVVEPERIIAEVDDIADNVTPVVAPSFESHTVAEVEDTASLRTSEVHSITTNVEVSIEAPAKIEPAVVEHAKPVEPAPLGLDEDEFAKVFDAPVVRADVEIQTEKKPKSAKLAFPKIETKRRLAGSQAIAAATAARVQAVGDDRASQVAVVAPAPARSFMQNRAAKMEERKVAKEAAKAAKLSARPGLRVVTGPAPRRTSKKQVVGTACMLILALGFLGAIAWPPCSKIYHKWQGDQIGTRMTMLSDSIKIKNKSLTELDSDIAAQDAQSASFTSQLADVNTKAAPLNVLANQVTDLQTKLATISAADATLEQQAQNPPTDQQNPYFSSVLAKLAAGKKLETALNAQIAAVQVQLDSKQALSDKLQADAQSYQAKLDQIQAKITDDQSQRQIQMVGLASAMDRMKDLRKQRQAAYHPGN